MSENNDAPIKPTPSSWHRQTPCRDDGACSICGAHLVHGWSHRLLPDGESVEVRENRLPNVVDAIRRGMKLPLAAPEPSGTYWQKRYV